MMHPLKYKTGEEECPIASSEDGEEDLSAGREAFFNKKMLTKT